MNLLLAHSIKSYVIESVLSSVEKYFRTAYSPCNLNTYIDTRKGRILGSEKHPCFMQLII